MKRNRLVTALPMLVIACSLVCCWAVGMADIPLYLPGGGSHEALPISDRRSGGGGAGAVPSGGSCGNIGQVYADNPFIGWPVTRFAGDWKVISAWFCDPTYFRGFTHWGIDLAARVTPTRWESIDRAEVIATSDFSYVAAAVSDGSRHGGMGNHVIVQHLVCGTRCGSVDEPVQPGQHLILASANDPSCQRPVATLPISDDPGAPTQAPVFMTQDLILDCREDGWKATYMHLDDKAVKVGMYVERGQVLGWIDNTGNSTGTHLHYQINGPGIGAIDLAPAMCPNGYDNGLRTIYRWQLPTCGGE